MRPCWIGILLLTSCTSGCRRDAAALDTKRAPTGDPVTDESGVTRFPPGSAQLARIKVQEVRVERIPLEEIIAPGKIEANPNRISRVTLPIPGRVLRVMVGIGDAVSQRQPLLALESPEVGAAISTYRQAQAKIGQAKAALLKAESDLSRVQDLYAGRAIAQKEVVSAQAILAQAKSDLEQAQAAGEESARRLEIFQIKPGGPSSQEVIVPAPLPGKILEISVAAGEYRTDTNAPVLTIADLSTVYMAADVPENAIRLFTVGESVFIRLAAFPQEELQGRVVRIADTVDAATRTIRVRVALPNTSGRFRPEMFGEIRHEENFQTVPIVPAGAVVQSDKRSVVFRERGVGVFEAVSVNFGKQRDGRVPVSSGLKAGDRIVVDGAMLLRGSQ